MGSTIPITPGSVSAVNSTNTQVDWPSLMMRSNMRTALLIQKIDTSTSAKNPNSTMNCDSIYLSNLVTSFSFAPPVRGKLSQLRSQENCQYRRVGGGLPL